MLVVVVPFVYVDPGVPYSFMITAINFTTTGEIVSRIAFSQELCKYV